MRVFSPAGSRTGKLIARCMFVSLGTGPTNGATLGSGDTAKYPFNCCEPWSPGASAGKPFWNSTLACAPTATSKAANAPVART